MSQNQPDQERPTDKAGEFEQFVDNQQHSQFVLRLYVTGLTTRSTQAIDNIKNICDEELKGRYELEVIDLAKQPELAKGENIIAAPTLIKKLGSSVLRCEHRINAGVSLAAIVPAQFFP